MIQNNQKIQNILSIIALICLAAGWLNIFNSQINHILYNIIFYIAIGLSFFFAARIYPNKNHQYIGYAAAALCIIGSFLPESISSIKTIGLFTGVILSFMVRPRYMRR